MVLVLTLAAAVLGTGGLAGLIKLLLDKGKVAAEATQTLTATALSLVRPLQEKIAALEEEVEACHLERSGLVERVEELEKVIGGLLDRSPE